MQLEKGLCSTMQQATLNKGLSSNTEKGYLWHNTATPMGSLAQCSNSKRVSPGECSKQHWTSISPTQCSKTEKGSLAQCKRISKRISGIMQLLEKGLSSIRQQATLKNGLSSTMQQHWVSLSWCSNIHKGFCGTRQLKNYLSQHWKGSLPSKTERLSRTIQQHWRSLQHNAARLKKDLHHNSTTWKMDLSGTMQQLWKRSLHHKATLFSAAITHSPTMYHPIGGGRGPSIRDVALSLLSYTRAL